MLERAWTMTAPSQARVLLEHVKQMPNATPAEALAEFRRLLAEMGLAKGKH